MPMTLEESALQAQLAIGKVHLSLALNLDTSGGEWPKDTTTAHGFQLPQNWALPSLGGLVWAGDSSSESWSPPCRWSQASQWPLVPGEG